jgi:hypothetical protein
MSTVIRSGRIELTGSAQPLFSSRVLTQAFAVRNESGNDDVYIGDSTVSTDSMFIRELETNEKEGRPITRGMIALLDLSKIFVLGTSGQFIRYEYLEDE